MRSMMLALVMWTTLSATAFAQQIIVQQPIVGSTSVSTSVVVPDGGRAFLGGVSSAQTGSSRFGFYQPGSSVGLARMSTSISASVTIVDLREMDEAILSSVRNRPEPVSMFAHHAAAIRSSRSESSPEPTREAESIADRAAKFERLDRKAEAEKRLGVAKLHWQMAEKYGSVQARERVVSSARQSFRVSRP